MSSLSASLEALHAPPTRWQWLLREMAPSEERWNATIRLVVAVVTVVVVSMALQTPLTAFSAYMAFFISKENRAITTIIGVLGCVGATIAIAASIFIYRYTFDYPEYRIPAMAAAVFGGMWLSRVLTIGPLGFAIGFLVGLIQSISDGIPTADLLVRQVLWLWVVVNLGFAVTVIVNIVLLPADPLMALEKGLKQRLELTIETLRRILGSNAVGGDADGVLVDLASRGSASLELNLKLAALKRPGRTRRAALAAAIRESERLVVAAANLGLRDPISLPAPDRVAAGRLVSTLTRLRRHPLDGDDSEEVSAADDFTPTLPELREMQRSLLALRDALGARDGASEAGPKERRRLFRPDAFSNKDHVRFALKVTLAAMTCYVIYMGVDWPGIRTAFITCCFVALESTGATTRKSILRLAGCALGGALGFLSIVYLIPHMESIVSLALLTAAVSSIAAWIAAGSERISYAGLQIALAFFLCIFQGFTPDTDFDTIRNRVVGIVLGIIVSSTVFRYLWPEWAIVKMRVALARMLRRLAQLVRIPATSATPDAERAAAEKLRGDLAAELNGILGLSELAALETGPPAEDGLSPERARKIAEGAQEVYLTAAILAGEAGLEEWSRLDAAAQSADLAARGAVAEHLGRAADATEAGRVPEGVARDATRSVRMPVSGEGERIPLVRRLVERTERVIAPLSGGRRLQQAR
jgi:multidrug resistance protein MdtO